MKSFYTRSGIDLNILQATADDYIAAQETADPTRLHFALWVDYNEQMQGASVSTGILSKPMKVDFHREVLDVEPAPLD